ncbi:MAG: hypothetical protein K0S47_2965 [Herbinix sp.]|nr:hypothetical protein [Herbinix sp.]
MKNDDYWNLFAKTGDIYDYLNYIACTSEEISEELMPDFSSSEKEGGFIAGINYRNGNGSVGHAGWGL